MIVIGTRRRTGLRAALLGSVSQSVVASAECPVLTFRSQISSGGSRAPAIAGLGACDAVMTRVFARRRWYSSRRITRRRRPLTRCSATCQPSRRRSMSMLGVILVLLGAALLVAEAHVPSHGALGTGGGARAHGRGGARALGRRRRCRRGGGGRRHRRAGRPGGRLVAGREVGRRAPLGRSQRPAGAHGPGGDGSHRSGADRPGGIDGALWRARMWDLEEEGAPMAEGSAVVIESIDGLTLTVRPAEEWEVR